MKSEYDKICNISDPEQLRSVLLESGDLSCAKCCARSNDPAKLCNPVSPPTVNLFCE